MPINPEAIDYLDALTGGAWRVTDLRLARLAPRRGPLRGSAPPGPDGAWDPLEAAWQLAALFGAAVEVELGRHCTPRTVARALARMVVDGRAGPLVDPACGAGALLLAALEARRSVTGRFEPDGVIGWDVDPTAVALAEAVVWVAAGAPPSAVGRFEERDFLRSGLGRLPAASLLLLNPPWGIRPEPGAVAAWTARHGSALAGLLSGELNVYTLFLLEVVLASPHRSGFITPIHWLHRRSLTAMRRALAASRRLEDVLVLRKRVFANAPDMIPALTCWRERPSEDPIRLRRTGFKAPIPLTDPPPTPERAQLTAEAWQTCPHTVFPLLQTELLSTASASLWTDWERLSDPDTKRSQRWFHIGDGAYKTRVRDHLTERPRDLPILTRAQQSGRYRLDAPSSWLTTTGRDRLTDGERERFARPKLILHALKKASAPWRLSAAAHTAATGALALTNNFLVVVPERFDGELGYPLCLLNSRLYNRLYTEHFPGVNIEAYTVGVLPLPWPVRSGSSEPPTAGAPIRQWWRWADELRPDTGRVAEPAYRWLAEAGHRLQEANGQDPELDHRIEAVVVATLGLSQAILDELLTAVAV